MIIYKKVINNVAIDHLFARFNRYLKYKFGLLIAKLQTWIILSNCSCVSELFKDNRIIFLFFAVAGRQNTAPNTPFSSK